MAGLLKFLTVFYAREMVGSVARRYASGSRNGTWCKKKKGKGTPRRWKGGGRDRAQRDPIRPWKKKDEHGDKRQRNG